MRPVAIFEHAEDVVAGYFETWLRGRGIEFRKFHPYRGEPVATSADAFSGICFMGGPMSVNDPLPWIEEELRLIRRADEAGVPVIGHCLGGQLMARAFGAPVTRHALKEIGWSQVFVADPGLARRWLADESITTLEMFQWHGDAFALPAGARPLLAGSLCANQAYVIERDGFAHLGMQFHCEMTPSLIRAWMEDSVWIEEVEEERRANGGPGVQGAEAMLDRAGERCAAMNALAGRLYARWSAGLKP
jgi:GMP synthase-like glutamine amidotransferase